MHRARARHQISDTVLWCTNQCKTGQNGEAHGSAPRHVLLRNRKQVKLERALFTPWSSGWVEVQLHSLLILSIRWRWVVTHAPAALCPGKTALGVHWVGFYLENCITIEQSTSRYRMNGKLDFVRVTLLEAKFHKVEIWCFQNIITCNCENVM